MQFISTHDRLFTFFREFREHPQSVGETYWQHLLFAGLFSLKLIAAGMAALVHAFIPSLFKTTASRIICDMHAKMMKRQNQTDGEIT